jgi:hypothetical protein
MLMDWPCFIIIGNASRSLCEIIIVVSHLRLGSPGLIFLAKDFSIAESVLTVSPCLMLVSLLVLGVCSVKDPSG